MSIKQRVKKWISKRNLGLDGWSFLFSPNNVATGQYLTEEDALKVSTVYRCVAILSQCVGTLPCVLYSNQENGGKSHATEHPLYSLLMFKPNGFQDVVNFFEQVMISLTLRGNAYIQVVRSNGMQILQLIPLMPDYIQVKGGSSNLTYEYKAPGDLTARVFRPDQMVHIRALPKNGIVGMSPIDKAMEAVGMAIAAEKFGGAFFANGVTPSGVFEHPMSLSDVAHNRLKGELKEQANKKHETLILEEGLKWHQMGITNEQAQFIASREFTVVDICRWFGVPPDLVGVNASGNNHIDKIDLFFLKHSLRPWLVRIEMALVTQLFEQPDFSKYTLQFLPDALLRADTVARYTSYNTALNNGFMCIDEVRARENLNPLPKNLGQDFYRPMNMYVVGDPIPPVAGAIGAAPTVSGASAPAAGTALAQDLIEGDLADGGRSKILSLQPIIDSAFGRIARRAEKVRLSPKKDWSSFETATSEEVRAILMSAIGIAGDFDKVSKLTTDEVDSMITKVVELSKEPGALNWTEQFAELICV